MHKCPTSTPRCMAVPRVTQWVQWGALCVQRYAAWSSLSAPPQLCEVLNATEMTCQAPALALGPDHQSDLTERPEEFGFILDNVQSLLILNKTNFTYYPNPVFEAFGPSGILELKPGTPIILKVDRLAEQREATAWQRVCLFKARKEATSHGLLLHIVAGVPSRGCVIAQSLSEFVATGTLSSQATEV